MQAITLVSPLFSKESHPGRLVMNGGTIYRHQEVLKVKTEVQKEAP